MSSKFIQESQLYLAHLLLKSYRTNLINFNKGCRLQCAQNLLESMINLQLTPTSLDGLPKCILGRQGEIT